MKVTHPLPGGEVTVYISDNGMVTVIGSSEVAVRMPYTFGAEGDLANVRKGIMEFVVRREGIYGMPQVEMIDRDKVIISRRLAALVIEEDKGKCTVIARDGSGDWTQEYKFMDPQVLEAVSKY
jgi:hypothetical protein